MILGLVVWFTGLSGSGKSSIATETRELLIDMGWSVAVLDGDQLRRSVGRHLGFSTEDIEESSRLAIKACRQSRKDHDVVLVPRISPFRRSRADARDFLGDRFIETYVCATLDSVQARDPKGLYARFRDGDGEAPIGVPGGATYEPPDNPELVLDTDAWDQHTLSQRLADYISSWLIGNRQ